MKSYDLYAVRSKTLDEARDLIERLVSYQFEARYSDYRGGDYYISKRPDEVELIIQSNLEPFGDNPLEDEFPDVEILLYVESADRSDEIRSALAKSGDLIELLRHEER